MDNSQSPRHGASVSKGFIVSFPADDIVKLYCLVIKTRMHKMSSFVTGNSSRTNPQSLDHRPGAVTEQTVVSHRLNSGATEMFFAIILTIVVKIQLYFKLYLGLQV